MMPQVKQKRITKPPLRFNEFHHGQEYPVTDSTDQEELDHHQNEGNMDETLARIANAVNGIKDTVQHDGSTVNVQSDVTNDGNKRNNNGSIENKKGNDSNHANGNKITNEEIEQQSNLPHQLQLISNVLTIPVVTAYENENQLTGTSSNVSSRQVEPQMYGPFNNVYGPSHDTENTVYDNYSEPYPPYTGWFGNLPPAKRQCSRKDLLTPVIPLAGLQPVMDLLQ